MLGRLDRYVAKGVLASCGVTLLFVVFLVTVFDLLVNMAQYLAVAEQKDLGLLDLLWLWLRYHAVSLPAVFVTLAPFVTVIGCMLAVARLMALNEVTPMVFTGRSAARVLLPALATGVLAAGLMTVAWECLLPEMAWTMERLRAELDDDARATAAVHGVMLRSADGRQVLTCGRYDQEHLRMDDVILLDLGTQEGDLAEVKARSALWNEEARLWELQDGHWRSGTRLVPRDTLHVPGVTPRLVWLSGKEAEMRTLLSCGELLALRQLSPADRQLAVSLHYHFTWPLANLVLLLLALPLAVRFERGSRIGRVLLAIAVCGAYLIVDLTCQNLGRREYLHPIVAAWTPAILFGSLGAVLFGGMRT